MAVERYVPEFPRVEMVKASDYDALHALAVELRDALEAYAECSDGCTCGDGWSHEPAASALQKASELL